MKVSRANPLALLVEKLNRDDLFGVGRILVRHVQLGSPNQGLFDTGVL